MKYFGPHNTNRVASEYISNSECSAFVIFIFEDWIEQTNCVAVARLLFDLFQILLFVSSNYNITEFSRLKTKPLDFKFCQRFLYEAEHTLIFNASITKINDANRCVFVSIGFIWPQ